MCPVIHRGASADQYQRRAKRNFYGNSPSGETDLVDVADDGWHITADTYKDRVGSTTNSHSGIRDVMNNLLDDGLIGFYQNKAFIAAEMYYAFYYKFMNCLF
jgi:hypothetical protein